MASPPPPTAAAASGRRLPPPCWSHEETLALIDAYRERWIALRRGHLRAADWDAVAAAASPAKTPTQCRHKVEKLRKRFRSERLRALKRDPASRPSSRWPFFALLDAMDLAAPPPPPPPPPPPAITSSSSGGPSPQPKKRRRADAEEGEMAAAFRAIGEGFLRTEQRRMEAAREVQKMRMEMELRRTQMVLDAQRRLVDALIVQIIGLD